MIGFFGSLKMLSRSLYRLKIQSIDVMLDGNVVDSFQLPSTFKITQTNQVFFNQTLNISTLIFDGTLSNGVTFNVLFVCQRFNF